MRPKGGEAEQTEGPLEDPPPGHQAEDAAEAEEQEQAGREDQAQLESEDAVMPGQDASGVAVTPRCWYNVSGA